MKFIISHQLQAFPAQTSVNFVPKKESMPVTTGNIFARLAFSSDRLLDIQKSHPKVGVVMQDEETNKLFQFLKRQKPEKLERYSEEMLHLCLLTHSIFESTVETINSSTSCSDLMMQSNPPSGRWDPMIRNLVGDFPAYVVPELCRIFANHGLEGSPPGSDSIFTSAQQQNLEEIQTNILIMIDNDPPSMENDIEELKEFASIVSDCEELALRSKEKILLRDFPLLKTFLQDRTGSLPEAIIGDLRVSHYSYLQDYLGKLLGLISYHVLSHSHLSTHCETEESHEQTPLQRQIYTPYISKDWMDSMTRQNQFTNPEFCKSAFEILHEKQHEGIQSAFDYFDYAYQSFELNSEDRIDLSLSEEFSDSVHQNSKMFFNILTH